MVITYTNNLVLDLIDSDLSGFPSSHGLVLNPPKSLKRPPKCSKLHGVTCYLYHRLDICIHTLP